MHLDVCCDARHDVVEVSMTMFKLEGLPGHSDPFRPEVRGGRGKSE